MAEFNIDYFDVARTQIDRALQLYEEGDWICSFTLARAAEGILRPYVHELGKKTLHQKLKTQGALELNVTEEEMKQFLRNIGNGLNHGQEEIQITVDEVRVVLICAVRDYAVVKKGEITEKMVEFSESIINEYGYKIGYNGSQRRTGRLSHLSEATKPLKCASQ